MHRSVWKRREMAFFSKRQRTKRGRRAASILAVVANLVLVPSSALSAPDTDLFEGEDGGVRALEMLVTTIFGQKALRASEALPEEVRGPLAQFWQSTLSLDCADKQCSTLRYTPESMARIYGLATREKDRAFLGLLTAYEEGKVLAQSDYLVEDINALFERGELSEREKLAIYAGAIPLLEQHALGSGDAVYFKKLQSVSETLSMHGYRTDQTVICSYVEDENMTFEVAFELSGWATGRPIEPEYRIISGDTEQLSTLACRIDGQTNEVGTRPRDALRSVFSASDALLNGLIARDQDTIDVSGSELLMAMNYARDELGWATGFTSTWKEEDAQGLTCKLLTLELQLLSQDRLVLAARIDGGLKALVPGIDFYRQLSKTEKCLGSLKGAYKDALKNAYEEHEDAYQWGLKNYAPDMRKRIDKAFASWTKRQKPAPAKFRREIASFTALSLGDRARAGAYALGMTRKLNRSNNPQVYGYDLAMMYARGETIEVEELQLRLHEMGLKSASHMFDTMSFARRFMSSQQAKEAVSVLRNFSPSLAPISSAMLISEYDEVLTGELSEENSVKTRIWALEHAWNAWRAADREAYANKILSDCRRLNDEGCIRQLSKRYKAPFSEKSDP